MKDISNRFDSQLKTDSPLTLSREKNAFCKSGFKRNKKFIGSDAEPVLSYVMA